MQRRSRFVYGDAGDWTPELTVKPWNPIDETVGGSKTAASGSPASYIVRRDQMMDVTLRVGEAEFADLLALVTFGQTAEAFLWYPEVVDNEPVEVYLETPAAGETWGPTRVGGYERLFEMTLRLRAVDPDSPMWVAYFDA